MHYNQRCTRMQNGSGELGRYHFVLLNDNPLHEFYEAK